MVDVEPSGPMAEWIKFFSNAHNMTEADVESQISDPGVRKAFEKATYSSLAKAVQDAISKDEDRFSSYALHAESLRVKGHEEGMLEGVIRGKEEGLQCQIFAAHRLPEQLATGNTSLPPSN